MSLDNFRNRTIIWDTVNKDFPQPVQIMQGDVNARTLLIKVLDNGVETDLTGHALKLTYQYTNNSNSGFVMIPPSDLAKGEFVLVIPTEMTKTGVIEANLILLNESLEQVIVSKNLTFISDNSTVTDLAQEVNNKIDDFTKLLLENMPQVMRSELNDLHAQTESNKNNIELKANQTDLIAIDLKVKNLSDSKADKGIFLYGDLIFNIDEKKLILNSVYLNYDYGDGLAIPDSTIDLSSIDKKVVYFDINNQSIKTDYYKKLRDGDIVIGYFNPEEPNISFNNTSSRVLFIKNGVTYSPEQFKTRGSILLSVYMSTFGDSVTSDQVSGTGTLIMNALGAQNGGNFATGWSTASDWHNGDTNITTVTLTAPNNTDTNDNVLSNQIRRQLQYTTANGQQITWTHPIDGTFSLDTAIGKGLGNTDKIPSVIYIAISTNDGKNNNVPVVDDTDTVFSQSYSQLTRNSLASGLRWAIETLQSAYPNANIFIASPLQTDKNSGHMSFPDGNLKREIVKKVARFTSVNYIDSFSESGFSALKNKALTVDGIHPSDVGKKKLVDYVTNEIRKKLSD